MNDMAEVMATTFFRLNCKEVTKDWNSDKKMKLAKKMSEVTLCDSRFHPHERRELWNFDEVPDRKFSALKLKSWMEQLAFDLKGFDVNPDASKLMSVFGAGD